MQRSGSIPTLALLLLASASSASLRGADTASPPASKGQVVTEVPAPQVSQASPITATVADTPVRAAALGMLRMGDSGPAVAELQQRLLDQGYWHDGVDGAFGSNTHHAVVALQKYWGLTPDGIVGPQTYGVLDRNERPRPFPTGGHRFEVDPRRQIVIIADDHHATWVLDASTGAPETPTVTGFFHVFRQVNGDDPGPFGPLYRPKYFFEGYAVHGYASVPTYPASHGCVRVTLAAMDMVWASGTLPIGTFVWVY
jgi:N-acetylmuramoyl-L-alanine amidase